ncbi:hypothetical protein [Chondromyces apiculatus]|uniref:Virulence-associated cell-wall-anchored protein SasG n=1 Tax=Chondromyces apiculatus DSM 436 TaxID=1192034 RepID=A0A017TB82_9BACT|nr:hypothetical protein [Chondromyces apiculatus]EYF06499.1 Virulence-associated cell-wall-anchored protein SasG [Chondromyces apiculatus DSM 436]
MSDAVHAADAEHHDPVEVEADRPKNGLIALYIAGLMVALVLIVTAVYELFVYEFTAQIQLQVLDPPNSALRELRASEEAKLTRYQWVSQKDGVVRVPLTRAIEVTLQSYREAAARPPEQQGTTTAPAEGTPAEGTPAEGAQQGEPKDGDAKDADKKDGDAKDAAAKDGDAKDADKKDADKKDTATEKPEVAPKKKAPKKPASAPAAPAPASGGEVY